MKNLIMASAICALMFSGLSAVDKDPKKEHKHHPKSGEVKKVGHKGDSKGHKVEKEKPCKGEKPCRHVTACKKHRMNVRDYHAKMHEHHMAMSKHYENMHREITELTAKAEKALKEGDVKEAVAYTLKLHKLNATHHKHMAEQNKLAAEHHKHMSEKKHKEHKEK